MEQFVCFLTLAAVSSALDLSLITVSVAPVSGVLLLTGPKGQYQFDLSEASEACLFKNLSVASWSQLQTALDQGLEACRFGWISEGVAAVPRLSSVSTCGSGKTGVVTWSASPQRQFGVWCFSHSDINEKSTAPEPQITTVSTKTAFLPQRTSTFTTPTATTLTFTATTTTATEASLTTRSPTSALASRKLNTAHTKPFFTTTTASKSPNTSMMALSPPAGSTSATTYDSSVTSVSVKPPRHRALSSGLIAFCVVVLVLSAGGAVFYNKLSERWVWPHAPQKDYIETETWKQTSCEVELQEEAEGEGRRFSSETMLYVNQDAQMD